MSRRTSGTRGLLGTLVLGVLLTGCGGGSDQGTSGDRADRPESVASAGATSTGDVAGSDGSSSSSSSGTTGSATGPGSSLDDLCTSMPIAPIVAEKVDGPVVVSAYGPRDSPTAAVMCRYGPKDFMSRFERQEKSAAQFSVVLETYPEASCREELATLKRAGHVVRGDHYEVTLGSIGICRGRSNLGVSMTSTGPASAADVALMRRMLAAAEPRMADLAERARLDAGRS